MGSTRTAVKAPRTSVDPPREQEVDLERLEAFRRFRRSADPQLRQELVCHYLPLAKKIARRYVRAGVPLDDLVQIGTIGLMNAVG
jgi:DNA-directed RNA polymerase specialized sigma subunit